MKYKNTSTMKEGTAPGPLTAPALIARETYYLFVKLSYVMEREVAEVKNPCTFKFYYTLLQSR